MMRMKAEFWTVSWESLLARSNEKRQTVLTHQDQRDWLSRAPSPDGRASAVEHRHGGQIMRRGEKRRVSIASLADRCVELVGRRSSSSSSKL